MHGLSQDTDLSFLNGKELSQLALGRYEFQLRFEGSDFISVQSMFSITIDAIASQPKRCEPELAKELYVLLGKKIERYQIGHEGELTLHFEGSLAVTIFDSNARLESYVIWNDGDFYAV